MPHFRFQTLFFLLLILLVAGLFRFYGLKSIPPGLYVDEATNGNNALEALETGKYRVFYKENNGREGLFINLQALSVKIFGDEPWALRLVSAVFGTLTVFGMYLLGRELYSEGIGLLSSFFTAVGFWHVNFSRIGFRAVSSPFFLIFGFYFLFKALKELRTTHCALYTILSGIFFGLGFYSYIAYRVMPILLLFLFFLWWRELGREERKRFWKITAIFLSVIFLVALPLGIYFLKNTADFFGRAGDVSIFKKPWQDSLRNVALTLGMFHIRGDWNWRHNFAGQPLLWWPVGIFFLAGIGVAIRDCCHKMTKLQGVFPLLWFGVMLLPNFLSPEGSPHALRALVTLPAVFLLSGIGAAFSGDALRALLPKMFPRFHRLLFLLLLFWFLLMHAGVTARDYFIFWANRSEVAEAFSGNYVEEGRFLRRLPSDLPKYVILNFGWGDVMIRGLPSAAQTVIFITGGWDEERWKEQNIRFIKEEELRTLRIPRGAFLVPLQKEKSTEAIIDSRWPSAFEMPFKYFKAYRI